MELHKLLERQRIPPANEVGGIFRFLEYIQRTYRRCASSNKESDRKTQHKMCLYLSYLLSIRDSLHGTRLLDGDVVPLGLLYRPGIKPCMQTVQKFAKVVEKDRLVNKRVKDRCSKLMLGENDFYLQCAKLESFFYRNKDKLNQQRQIIEKLESGHPLEAYGFSVAEIDLMRKVHDNSENNYQYLNKETIKRIIQLYNLSQNIDKETIVQHIEGDKRLNM